jgi:hypothetical protein
MNRYEGLHKKGILEVIITAALDKGKVAHHTKAKQNK